MSTDSAVPVTGSSFAIDQVRFRFPALANEGIVLARLLSGESCEHNMRQLMTFSASSVMHLLSRRPAPL